MMKNETHFSRRQILKIGFGVGTVAVLGGTGFAQTAERIVTPEVGMGPFYPMSKPLDKDADMTSVRGQKGAVAAGTIVHVAGRVFDQKGTPVKRGEDRDLAGEYVRTLFAPVRPEYRSARPELPRLCRFENRR